MKSRADAWLAAAAIAAALTAFAARAQSVSAAGGNDFELICASAEVLDRGGNPFDPEATEAAGAPAGRLLTHPPLVPRVLEPVCAAPALLPTVLAALALIFISWRLLGASLLMATIAVVSGFAAFPWILISGNPAMFEAIAVGLACQALLRDRAAAFGLALAPAVYVKSFVPLPFALAACVRWNPRRAAVAVITLAAALTLLFGADWLVDRDTAMHYWDAVLNRFGPWGMAELRGAGEYSPSPFAFMPIATGYLGAGRGAGIVIALAISAALVLGWFRSARVSPRSAADRTRLAFLAIAVLVVVHPRFKPYSPFVLTPVLGLALTNMTGRARAAAVALACIAPNVFFLALTLSASGPRMPAPIVFGLQYAQWVLTAMVVALALRHFPRTSLR